jgi:hypothetical protein
MVTRPNMPKHEKEPTDIQYQKEKIRKYIKYNNTDNQVEQFTAGVHALTHPVHPLFILYFFITSPPLVNTYSIHFYNTKF